MFVCLLNVFIENLESFCEETIHLWPTRNIDYIFLKTEFKVHLSICKFWFVKYWNYLPSCSYIKMFKNINMINLQIH